MTSYPFFQEFIGEEKLAAAVPEPTTPKKSTRLSRRQHRLLNGYSGPEKTKQRWVGKFTDDSKLFEYAPEFERKLRRLNEERVDAQERKQIEVRYLFSSSHLEMLISELVRDRG
jgi:hypothetical protein